MRHDGFRNARFVVFGGMSAEEVKLTLREGQSVRHYRGGRTEEGYHEEWHTWTLTDGVVYHEWETDGRDCDGRFSTEGIAQCPLGMLKAHEFEGLGYPKWEVVKRGQRDYSAEAMGY